MTAWRIRYSKEFYKELAQIPAKTRQQIEAFIFDPSLQENPLSLSKIEKLVGHDQYYKVRFGKYRLGLRMDKDQKILEFRRARHRKDIYRKFP